MADPVREGFSLGRYEVAGHLAAGGMAEVLLARVSGPRGFERPVVLKRILPHLAHQASFREMFLDEARTIARIHHANVVDVYELGAEREELFLVMEYLEGESVASLLRTLVSRNQALPPRLAAFIAAEACAGLHAAHELRDEAGKPLNVVHRDVSPQNVFVTYDGAVKVIDFGIAKAADKISRTEAGQVKGKLEFMSPEQCKSEPLDRRADIFALGVVLYELVAMRRLFKRPSPAGTIKAIMQDPIIPPSRVTPSCPSDLERICMRALERNPAARYDTALEMRRELVAFLATARSDQLPEEELAALMSDVLGQRRAAKEEMLQRVREGSNPTRLPEAEAAIEVDIPVVDPSLDGTDANLARPTGARAARSRVPRLIGLSLSATAIGVVAFAVVHSTHGDAGTARPATPTPAPTLSAAALPRTVSVVVESEPSHAVVLLDDADAGVTPMTLTLPRSNDEHTIVLHKAGFHDQADRIQANVEQKLRLTLSPLAPRSRTPHAARREALGQPAKW